MGRILNFGSLNLDYVYRVSHLLRSGETLGAERLDQFPGGKGLNQSVAMSRAGAEVFHAGKVGPEGGPLVEALRASGVDVACIQTGGSRTGHAVIQVAATGQNCILLYPGANFELDEADVRPVFAGFGQGDVLVLQNEVNHIPLMLALAKEKGMRVFFNPSHWDDAIRGYPLEAVDCFVLNEVEGEQMTGRCDPGQILDKLAQRYPDADHVLTLGKEGVVALCGGRQYRHGVYRVPVVDTTAAGDTFTGYLVASLSRGQGMERALQMASMASSLAVSKPGASVSVPTLEVVLASNLVPE